MIQLILDDIIKLMIMFKIHPVIFINWIEAIDMSLENLGFQFRGEFKGEMEKWRQENKSTIKEIQDVVKTNFVADCLLANWDVVGLEFDNLKYDPVKKKIWRIDTGSGLDFKAQGGKKILTSDIQEFETLRDSKINPQSSWLFATLEDKDIIQQIDDILPRREAFLATIPDHLKEVMGQRFDYLDVYKQKLNAI